MNSLLDPEAFDMLALGFESKYSKELSMSRNIDQFYSHIGLLLRYMGLSEYSFSRVSLTQDIITPLFIMPLAMYDIYFSKEYYKVDPITQYILANDKPIFLSEIQHCLSFTPYETAESKIYKEIFALLKSYDYTEFFYIPFGHMVEKSKFTLAIATKSPDLSEFHTIIEKVKPQLIALTRSIQHVEETRYPGLMPPTDKMKKINLNPDHLELLQIMVRDDLTLVNAAERLNISRDIANRRIKSIKHNLCVNTIAKVIWRVVKAGLIKDP